MRKYTIVLVVLLFIAAASCTHDPAGLAAVPPGDTTNVDPGDTITDTSVAVNCSPDTVYFRQTILPLLVNSCGRVGCHSPQTASDGVVIADYASIMQTADVRPGNPDDSELYEVLVEDDEEDRMPRPPDAPLTAEQIAAVRKWIQQGARDNSCVASSGCELPQDVTYAGVLRPVLQTNCFGCHSSSVATGGIVLDTYQGTLQAATSGRLYGATKRQAGYQPMPPGGPLPACDIKKIEEWINQGYKP